MRCFRPFLTVGAIAAAAACSEPGPVASALVQPEPAPLLAAAPGRAVEGSYVVVLKEGATPRAVAAATGVGARHVYAAALNGFSAELTPDQLASLRRHPGVRYVEEDQRMEAMSVPWGLDRIDQLSLPLDGVYQVNTVPSNVSAYVIDTGIDTSHPGFAGMASNAFDVTGGGPLCSGHGTAVAGVLGSTTHGVAAGVQLKSVRVVGCGSSATTSQVIAGVNWVAANHVPPAVANISLAGGVSMALNSAVTALVSSGVFTAAAVVNGGGSSCSSSPASATGVVGVGPSTITDAAGLPIGPCLDIYAPGSAIPTLAMGGGTITVSGSSIATPHVTGVAALYLANNPTATPAAVTAWIMSNATTLGSTTNPLVYKSTL